MMVGSGELVRGSSNSRTANASVNVDLKIRGDFSSAGLELISRLL